MSRWASAITILNKDDEAQFDGDPTMDRIDKPDWQGVTLQNDEESTLIPKLIFWLSKSGGNCDRWRTKVGGQQLNS